MIDKAELRLIVKQVLTGLAMHSMAAENLVLGTIAKESCNGKYLEQIGGGPALGLCQIEPATEKDIWRYIMLKKGLANVVSMVTGVTSPNHQELRNNHKYGVALCRIKYWMNPDPLPEANDIPGMALVWKKTYNTPAGAGTEQGFIEAYEKYVA